MGMAIHEVVFHEELARGIGDDKLVTGSIRRTNSFSAVVREPLVGMRFENKSAFMEEAIFSKLE